MAEFSISKATQYEDVADTVKLFEVYAQSLGIDLTFQDFAREMTSMPGKYAPPKGCLLLARNAQGEAIGCVGLRQLAAEGCCEMKRLYVSPKGRGLGVGKALAETAIEEARRIGYQAMRLDTLPDMAPARQLYKSLDFVEIEPYYESPLVGTIFLELVLQR